MIHGRHGHFWLIVGSFLVAAGSTLAGLYAFEGNLLAVMFGFLLFIFGYRVSQVGTTPGTSGWTDLTADMSRGSLLRGCLLVVGWIGIAVGVTMFSQTVLRPRLSNAVVAGVASIGGYMAAHVGINGVGLGDSVFGPLVNRLSSTRRRK